MYNPLESVLYEKVKATFGRLDAVVTCPPEIMADMALINSLQFAGQHADIKNAVPADGVRP